MLMVFHGRAGLWESFRYIQKYKRRENQQFMKKSILSKPTTSEAFEKGEKKMVKNTVENRGRRGS